MALNNHVENFTLDMAPGGTAPVLNVSQGDTGRAYTADMYWGGASYDVSGLTVRLRGRKRDNTVFDYALPAPSGTKVSFDLQDKEQVTIIPGNVECELVFTDSDSRVVGTANFVIIVEEAPYDPNAISESEVDGLSDLVASQVSETIAEDIAEAIDGLELTRNSNGVVKIGDATASGTAGTITGFFVHDEVAETDGVSKLSIEAVDGLNDIIDEITDESDTFAPLTPVKTVTGKYAFQNGGNYKVDEVTDSSFGYKVFEIVAGNTYEIYGFGYDRYQFYMALLADNSEVMEDGHYVSSVYENVLCGTDAFPSGYTYHTITKVFEESGFLFVNYRTAQTEAACGIAQLIPKKDPAIEKLESSEPYHGVVVDGANYYHFVKYGGEYLFRHFKRTGANNLFQWFGIEKGTLTSSGVNIEETVITYDTDIIGPISIFNTAIWPGQYGMWSGGNHGKNIDGTNYPTATQESFKILVNGEEVTNDGVYYGDVKIITVNSLYFPQSVTGADLSTATKAITETREYNLDNQMHVRVKLAFEETTRVTLYYGMQAVIRGFNNILFVNNELYKTLPNATGFNIPKEENEVILTADTGLRLILNLKRIGLGTFNRNDGAIGYGTLPASSNTNKVYYHLIEGASAPSIAPGTVTTWEGDYILEYT